LNNLNIGLSPNVLKDIQKTLAKVGDICYVGDRPGDLVLFIHTTPATYHGTHVYTDTSSSAAAATSGDGSAAAAAASSSSSVAVPYDVDYSVFILDIELPGPNGTFKVIRTFDQKGLYRTIYGIGYGKGKHPIPNVIEAAVGWLHSDFDVSALAVANAEIANEPAAKVGQMAKVSVESNVAGADIEVDGVFVGSTPSVVSVTVGQHSVSVKRKGYAAWSRTMNVTGDGTRVDAQLEPQP
jgi:hypothetical protein